MNVKRPVVVITGATSGLGLALARLYQARGADLVLLGRQPSDDLDRTLFLPSRYCQVDLLDPEGAYAVERFLYEHGISRIDVLIHNAAAGYYGAIEDQSARSIRDLVDVNLRAPVALTHLLLGRVLETRGNIVFVSSVAAALPAPEYAVYAATKAALEAFARNLRIELGHRATVQTVAPGAIRTSMHEKSGAPLDTLGWHRFPTADTVAGQIIRAIDSGRADVTMGRGNRLVQFSGRMLPRLIDQVMARRRR